MKKSAVLAYIYNYLKLIGLTLKSLEQYVVCSPWVLNVLLWVDVCIDLLRSLHWNVLNAHAISCQSTIALCARILRAKCLVMSSLLLQVACLCLERSSLHCTSWL